MTIRCEGDACAAISIRWDETAKVYLIRNTSEQSVVVTLHNWAARTELQLDPLQVKRFEAKEFDYPFHAWFFK
jgi:hypothetical protein